MNITEFRLKIYMLKSVNIKGMLEQISKIVDCCLINEGMRQVHEDTYHKLYTFNGFYPVEPSGVYEEGQIYSVTIRTLDKEIKEAFKRGLAVQCTSVIKALTTEHRDVNQKYVEKIFSITPVILKFDQEGYWREHHSVSEFERRIKVGLVKKYNMIYDTKLDEDFDWVLGVKFDNHKPIASDYKNIQLLGDKVTIHIADNEIAQKLAWIAVGSGIGEMCARGYGFVNFRYL